MASTMPSTSRLGMMLVYRLPGARTMTSASSRASTAAGRGCSGISRTRRMRQSCSFLQRKDPALAHYAGSVFKGGLQLHVRRCHRQHPAGNGQHLTHALHRPVKAGHNAVEGRQEQIAEALSCQRPLAKSDSASAGPSEARHWPEPPDSCGCLPAAAFPGPAAAGRSRRRRPPW